MAAAKVDFGFATVIMDHDDQKEEKKKKKRPFQVVIKCTCLTFYQFFFQDISSPIKLQEASSIPRCLGQRGEASIPSLGAFFGHRLVAVREALGAPPDPSLVTCQRFDTSGWELSTWRTLFGQWTRPHSPNEGLIENQFEGSRFPGDIKHLMNERLSLWTQSVSG
ncbi:hypothetical protein RHMOL_Rhmol02G0287900 [Rhododendron molle]|uniref:Uncharacterized protein n=1 Tax=Rhododendron molle TaxID=49168 RepID=A0ACC0PVN7_RHOML|nr:hypothetical protein RHMOL_Rhmol02G0287900 [Rhododendron molle]